MRTQSADTTPEIEQIQIAGLRTFAPAKRFASARSISASMHFSALWGQGENLSDYERALTFLKHFYPSALVDAFRTAIPPSSDWVLQPFDLLPPLVHVSNALDQAQIPYALTGSLARAIYGFPRGVHSIEVLVEADVQQVTEPVQALCREQFVITPDWSVGEGQQSLCLLYLPGLVRLNLFSPGKPPPFDAWELTRTQPLVLDQHLPRMPVLTPEELVLQGVVHYQATGACDDDLYNEILGILKIQAPTLDQGALATAAVALGVQEVLERLFEDADMTEARHILTSSYS